MAKNVTRLANLFRPKHYVLDLDPSASNMVFSGSVVITGQKLGRPSQRLTLHQKGLKITKATLTKHDKKGDHDIVVDRINTHSTFDELRLHTTDMLYPGHYTVTIRFEGKITPQMNGMYPCFFEHEGKQKKLLATQFESHHAREVFPCIDEPAAKATFELTLTSPLNEVVLANTPIKTQASKDDRLVTTFETTPIMSTYLLAWVIGDLHAIEGVTKRGIAMRSWGHIGQPKKFLQYANDEAIKVIDFFEDYFDTPFPLTKCDQVALPDFESGAMENWGLITYREVALLADPDNRSVSSEQYVSMVIAHELSHQWFGNLVTMEWWDDLWLNESFASLMEHFALAVLHPGWNQWEHYASSDIISCSSRDIYKDVQPVRMEVRHPDEISTLFDPAIVYAKGGRLLKMLHDYIGSEAFQKGLKIYFEKHRFQNTTRDDLWAALSAASGQDVNAFMNPWLEQSGMPVVTVARDSAQKQLHLTQKRFVLDADAPQYLWPIPLLASETLHPSIFTRPEGTVAYTSEATPLLNINGSGHYIVHYEKEAATSMANAVQKQAISPEARINTLNDLLLLARRGDISIVDVLAVIKQCSTEPRDAVWSLLTRAMGTASMLGEYDEKIEESLKHLKREMASKWFSTLGWDEAPSEDPNTVMLRGTMIALMISAEDEDTLSQAMKRYKQASSIEALPAEQRTQILDVVVRHGQNESELNTLIDLYQKTQNPDLQLSIAAALTYTKDEAFAKKLIEEGMRPDGFVRPQDIFRWFAHLMRNKYTREVAWEWLTSSWGQLEKQFGGGKSLDYFVAYSAGPLHTDEWLKRFETFFAPKRNQVALQRNINIAVAEITARTAWHKRDIDKLRSFDSKS